MIDEKLIIYPPEFNGYTLVKVYPNVALYKHPGGWYECFQPYDVGIIRSADIDWSKWN